MMKLVKLLFALLSVFFVQNVEAIDFRKEFKLNDHGREVKLNIVFYLPHADAEVEKVLSQKVFGVEASFEQAAEAYAKKFKKLHYSANPRILVSLLAKEEFYNPETSMLSLRFTPLYEERVALGREEYLTYDLKNHKLVQLTDLITPTLKNHLISQGVDVENITNIKTFGHLIIAQSGATEVRMTPYKLHKHMTDYALELAGLDRKQIETGIVGSETDSNTGKVFDVVEQMPRFPGGQSNLFQYLCDHIKYPVEAEEAGIKGRVVCSFVIDYDGSITDVQVQKSVHPALDREAVRVISTMPNWIPGYQLGKTVRVKYTMPITFNLR